MKSILTLFSILIFLLPCKAQTEEVESNSNYGITFSFPWINYYNYINYHKNTSERTFGFFGLGFSGYYKKEATKISVNYSFTEDLSSPLGGTHFTNKDLKTSISCSYFEIIYHYTIYENVNFVGGFNITNYNFRLASKLDSVSSFKRNNQTIGVSAGLEYRFNNYYSVAAMYRPALASFETDGKYRHLINLEFRIDLDFKKKNTR